MGEHFRKRIEHIEAIANGAHTHPLTQKQMEARKATSDLCRAVIECAEKLDEFIGPDRRYPIHVKQESHG